MSSETSISSHDQVRLKPDPTSSDALQPWQLFTLAGLIGATIVVFVSKGQTPAGIILLSLTIFTAAVVGIAAWRTFAPFSAVAEREGAQMLGGRTRVALEREKALVLRSIKELEFDRAMGKVSEKDFAEMGARMRVRAAGLIRQLDAGASYRDEIEKEIAKRIGAGSKDAAHEKAAGSKDPAYEKTGVAAHEQHAGRVPGPADQIPGPAERTAAAEARANFCSACGTTLDADARFCKHCGARVEAAS